MIASTLAPLLRASVAAVSMSQVRPLLETSTATSPRASSAADMLNTCGSEYATVGMPRRKNLCWISSATMPELPQP
ncbi:hypothetical protein CF68_00410 [Cupriavidus sp. SK-4]|nr:hypothetical protein CF68_00410 [Cupriavidus sp. SK-4]